MTEIEKETGMTDAECEYWDEYITKNPVHLGPELVKLDVKPGFAHDYFLLNEMEHHDVVGPAQGSKPRDLLRGYNA